MKEKALAEEMKKMYGTERGSRRIIIKRISDATTRMSIKNHGVQVTQEVPQGGSPCWVHHN
jgi:hypothetical protein